MQSGAVILLFLIWYSSVICVPAEWTPTHQISLGDRVFNKQEECEDYINESIDAILDDEDSDPQEEFPIADDNYHDCKEELDKLKREYISSHNIDKSTNTEFFTVELNDGSTKLISAPAEEGAEVRELEFDVNEELCVTEEKCSKILGLVRKEIDPENKERFENKFLHCHVLLDMIKHKYVAEKKLNETKLKQEGGLSVKCTGKLLKTTLPQSMNNLDYNTSPHELYGGLFKGDVTHLPPEGSAEAPGKDLQDHQDLHDHPAQEEKHEEHAAPDEKTSTSVKGTPSKAVVEKPHIISCVLVILVLVTVI